ncbi:hypothetical protein [Actinacidiphila acidipaludis]|uniref:Integral membrane protein n=1 Tax=Actinacidiphila acidipaludis TaxID=2873382 RepID=A0ABS7Q461_9ACTN|nr:hypothetical protein [Streptomyces acidipaludis]MBY8876827.1 hypothetical protein [Streptomyces acidipaludis]
MVKRSRSRRVAERAWGLVLLARVLGLGAITALILASGVWASWQTAQHVMLTKGRERGTVTLAACGDSSCTGPFMPEGAATARPKVTVSLPVRHKVGAHVPVVLKPGTDTGIRAGLGGVLFAWLPLGGALLLAAVVVGGGLRMPRTAWTLAAAGAALVGGAFLTL